MSFLVWCGCVTVCLAGLELSLFARDGWRWLWIPLLTFYGLAGLGLAIYRVVRVAAGKLSSGVALKGVPRQDATPATRKDETER
ncbi:MAG: hypothetical protein HRJ53_07505 [Acidobacteria bacterium Pan2503]|uniref:Uncharacterized protein n=1 Tax=Candidatus Acidiferrum panamense TaxID=2741543 RepID=A0A7V8SWD4_9BACT|nr:hypothetical protein [Candidatus Acidoferrum panamensis]